MESDLQLIESKLKEIFASISLRPELLHEAIVYAVGDGGKRVRPLVCLAAAQAVGGRREDALYPACAVEILHNCTLVHDDLPAMDNDRIRRGKPTVWVKYGEANAVLAGDALLSLAYQVAAKSPRNVADIVYVLGERGVGVVAGQVEDLAFTAEKAEELIDDDFIYRHKTADLFVAAAVMGGLAAGAGQDEIDALGEFALNLGLAFQYQDDLLDGDGIYPRAKTAELADVCTAKALEQLARLSGDVSKLSDITMRLVGRKK
jgi:geranylgeranyl diphosphate synthase type II